METSNISHNLINNTTAVMVQQEDTQKSALDISSLVQVISVTCYSITFILGIVGNGLVIWIAGLKMKKMVNTIWFLNLGIVDFAFDILLPFQIVESIMGYEWIFGRLMCKIVYLVVYLKMLVSTSFLSIISVDCCISVFCPVWSKNHRTTGLASIISVVIWVVCLAFSVPYVTFYDIRKNAFNENISYCDGAYISSDNMTVFDYNRWKQSYIAMVIVRFLSVFLFPFTIFLFCYCLITLRVKKNRSLSVSDRTFKIIIATELCFYCFWFTFHIFRMLEVMDMITDWTVYEIVLEMSYCLAYFSSCLNPILYVIIGCDLKRNFLKSIAFFMESAFTDMEPY